MMKSIFTKMAFSLCLIMLIPQLLVSQNFMRELEHGTIAEKTRAMHHLGYAGNKKAFWLYVKYLNFEPENDTGSAVKGRMAAAEALGRIQDDRAVPFLLERWQKEKNESVKQSIMFAFRYYRDEKIAPLIKEGLSSENELLIFNSLMTASRYNNQELAPDLVSVREKAKDDTIKIAASFALIMLEHELESNRAQLISALSNREPETRYWAAYYLAESEQTEAIDAIIAAKRLESNRWVDSQMDRSIVVLRTVLSERKKAAERNYYEKVLN